MNTITLWAELWLFEIPGHCSVASSSLIFSSTLWAVFKETVLPPIAAIMFSVTSWSYLVPRILLITLASWAKLVDTNPAGKLILISSTMPFCTSKLKFKRYILPSWAGKSSVRVTVNFGVLPKFQSQERNSLTNLSIPAQYQFTKTFQICYQLITDTCKYVYFVGSFHLITKYVKLFPNQSYLPLPKHIFQIKAVLHTYRGTSLQLDW